MKITPLLIFLSLVAKGCATDLDKIKTLNTNEPNISININNENVEQEWMISEKEIANFYEIECSKKTNTISVSSDIDSIYFNISAKDTILLNTILNKKDTIFSKFIGVKPNINFTEEYIAKHTGKVTVEIPEVSELANILVALHKDVETDRNIVNSETIYYTRVKKHFAPYLNHPIIDTIHRHINGLRAVSKKDTIFSNESYLYYITLKMNACAYSFDSDSNIVNNGYIREMAKGWNSFDPMKDVNLMEDFAKKSNFRAFYKTNKPYYDSIITIYNSLNPITKMQKWLDKKFEFSYGNYAIYFSPLIGGAHSAQKFKKGSFNQSLMFIAPSEYNDNSSKIMNELRESRVVFTEIDHNYVNPTSDKYIDQINTCFSNRDNWTKGEGTELYETPYMIFNEYMTFGIYSLYVYDNYKENELLEFLPQLELQMNERGFVKFKDFNRKLLERYSNNEEITIDELYTYIFKWAISEN